MKKAILVGIATGVVCLTGAAFLSRFKIAGPSQYIVKTGFGIPDIHISKKTVQWPLQTYSMLSLEPKTFPVEVAAMSRQRIPFILPSVWTVGAKDNQLALEQYARLLMNKSSKEVVETIEGVIHGELRILTANMDLDRLFSDRETFKQHVVVKINDIVQPFGLTVYNANIAELKDLDKDNQYFAEQKRRALQLVNQQARVDVSEAIKDGEIGERKNQSLARQGVAHAEKEALLIENDRDREIAESMKNLQVAKTEYNKATELAQIKATAQTEVERWEQQMKVETVRKQQELEKKRADEFTTTQVNAEIALKEAEARAQAKKIEAEAELYAKQQEAIGILAIRQAEATGLGLLITAAGGSVSNLNQYIMVRDGILPKLASEQAKALQGLNPRISIWNTGPPTNNVFSTTMTDLFKTGMPLFDGIKQQTGYDFMKSVVIQEQNDVKDAPKN